MTSVSFEYAWDLILRFEDINPDFLDREVAFLKENLTFKALTKEELLFERGLLSKTRYIVLDGIVRSFVSEQDNERTLDFFSRYDIIIAASFGKRDSSSVMVSAVTDSIIISLDDEIETRIVRMAPNFSEFVRKLYLKQILKFQSDLEQLRTASPEERYLEILHNRTDLLQEVSQYHLANYLGITPQSLSRLKSRIFAKKRR